MVYIKSVLMFVLSFALVLGPPAHALAAAGEANPSSTQPAFKKEEIEQLAAPVALYPDALLAQVLMASTYPMEVVLAARWAKAHSGLKGQDLEKALGNENWDPSVKSLVSFPQVLQMMNDKIDWTQKLGDAFLAQQADVMDAVQRLRAAADAQGALKSGKEQKVSRSSSSGKTVYVIEPSDPQVVYVPSYNPTVVYGAWPYPSYPPASFSPAGYVATGIVSFGLGLAVGSALWGGCDWGYGGGRYGTYINVNNYNTFNKFNRFTPPSPPPPPPGPGPRPPHPGMHDGPGGQVMPWRHDGAHRQGVPYANPDLQKRFNPGGAAANASREAFRGRISGMGEGRDGFARPQSSPGRGGAGERKFNRPNLGQGGAGERQRISPRTGEGGGRENAFSGLNHAKRANIESARGAQSRQMGGHIGGGGGGGHFGGGHGGFRR